MKKFWIYFGGTVAALLILVYLAFLFYLPRAIDLNTYLPQIEKIVKDQADIDLSIENPKIITNPLLQAGIKTGRIQAKLPDGSTVLDTEGIKLRVSLPNLLWLTVKVSCAEIYSPKINLEIIDGEQFKAVRLVEDILNKKKNEPQKEVPPSTFNPERIKIKVPNAKISDYSVLANDLKTGHKLILKGDILNIGYNNKKTARIKTNAQLFSDNNTNINLNIDIDSFIPEAKPKDPDDDPAEKIEIPFVNPVLVYRDYDLKSDINARLKLRQNKEKHLVIKGYTDIEKVTVNLSGLQLPYSNLKAKFFGNKADIDTNIVVKDNQEINLKGSVSYGKNPNINLNFYTDKIYFNDMIILAKAFLNTLHIKNNLDYLKASGYWIGRCNVKSDFKKLQSNGSIIAREGNITNNNTQLVFDKINANLIFEGNKLKIVDTHTFINGGILKAEGFIDTDSYSDIIVHSEKLPLPGLFLAFAPSNVKKSIALTSGALSVDAKVQGQIKKAVAYANVILDNLALQNDSMRINDEKLIAGIVTDLNTIDGQISNKNFRFLLPKTNSTIQNSNISIRLTNQNINLSPTVFNINNQSKINISGSITDYTNIPSILFDVDGSLNANDLKQFAGREAEPFIVSTGNLPLKAKISGTDKKQEVILQVKSDASNYITPIDIETMMGNDSILQAKIYNKKDGLQIRNTGFYTNVQQFGNNLDDNLKGAKEIAVVSGTIVHTNTSQPFINRLKIDIPHDLNAKFSAFQRSAFRFGGDLLLFGKTSLPFMKGSFKISDLTIPEIFTAINSAELSMFGQNITLSITRLILNGSDLNINLRTDINPHPIFTISGLNISSRLINLDTIVKVPEALAKYLAAPKNSSDNVKNDIPVLVRNGSINLRTVKTGNITADNTTSRLSMRDNNLFINDIKSSVFKGKLSGDVVVNLLDMLVGIKINGENLDVKKALLDLANTKDALTGTMRFNSDLTLNASDPNDLMKSIKGSVVFSIEDGQLGPFGKLENMILAENIRESKFFQTALGGVINNLATVDTSRFKIMNGVVILEDGIAIIEPITTIGNVMSLHLAGKFDILQNTLDMKVRAKLGSAIANMLGPISQINPINLVQATPGLNVVMAKTFFLFCEQLTPEETAALPHLETDLDDKMATKFQIVLRGDVAKPLTLVKSFKWLALASEIEKAKGFVDSLPDPSVAGDGDNITIEDIIRAQEEKAKEDAKLKNRIKRMFAK